MMAGGETWGTTTHTLAMFINEFILRLWVIPFWLLFEGGKVGEAD